MTSHSDESLKSSLKAKQELRRLALASRGRQQHRETLSRRISERLVALPEYKAATGMSIYIGGGPEVQTLPILPPAWSLGKRIAVPCCIGDHLELFWLENVDELTPRTLGILEPNEEIRGRGERRVDVTTLDLIVVPGVAFDPRGGRVGHGKGYYDKLLRNVRPDTVLAALAFECQVFPEVPVLDHDVFMDKVVTERGVYQRKAR
jgi:5-formyltetrahydrofolate cyclo-ligase